MGCLLTLRQPSPWGAYLHYDHPRQRTTAFTLLWFCNTRLLTQGPANYDFASPVDTRVADDYFAPTVDTRIADDDLRRRLTLALPMKTLRRVRLGQ